MPATEAIDAEALPLCHVFSRLCSKLHRVIGANMPLTQNDSCDMQLQLAMVLDEEGEWLREGERGR